MPLSNNQKQKIFDLLSEKMQNKLDGYGSETTSMPFLARLVQDNEKIAAYSFIHSMATTLGMSIYEDISALIASETAEETHTNYKNIGHTVSKEQKSVISKIVSEIRNGDRTANIGAEKEEVLRTSSENKELQRSGLIVDFYMKRNGEEHCFEIKTAKPNIDVFEKSKTKLLEWVARRGCPINVYLVFPYNPYHPEPYKRFTEVGMMDHPNDFLIGEEYWDFLGGKNTFPELLKLFDEVGKNYQIQLNEKFKQIAEEKIDYY